MAGGKNVEDAQITDNLQPMTHNGIPIFASCDDANEPFPSTRSRSALLKKSGAALPFGFPENSSIFAGPFCGNVIKRGKITRYETSAL
jgi:hypothetical protein